MRSLTLLFVLSVWLSVGGPSPAAAQNAWVPAQPPCELEPGHGVVSDGINQLRNAIENPAARPEQRLDQAYEAFTRALREHDQGSNPALWYYLGRVFVETKNAIGADTAFARAVALRPECADDAAQYTRRLMSDVEAEALRGWQEGKVDSAEFFFALAGRLDPAAASVPLYHARMLADQGQLDAARQLVDSGHALVTDDPNQTRLLRQATLDVVRGLERQATASPAMQTVGGHRIQRDTLARNVVRDSTTLAALIAEWAGQNLRPEVQQAVSRDSAALEQRLAAWRAALPAAREAMTRDSTAVANAGGEAIRAYDTYLQAFPDDVDAGLKLLRLYSAAGWRGEMEGILPLITEADDVSDDQLLQAGVALFNEGHPVQAAHLLERALERNPFNRGALIVLSRSYMSMGNMEALQTASQRLRDLDPLNPQTMQIVAAALNMAGAGDSARYYMDLARGGMGLAVSIQQFLPTQTSVIVNGSAQNIGAQATPATTLIIEFLDSSGQVVGSQTVAVPSLQPNGQHQISVRANVSGAVGWRYRKQ